jgi:uncharacterized protein YgbK (DUF1537 family)
MAATPLPVVTILADDLTGACDTGCLFAGVGPVAVVISPIRAADDRPVIAVDTETRTLPDAAAAGDLRAAALILRARVGAGPGVKASGSTVRGPVGAGVAALAHGPPFRARWCALPSCRASVVRHGRPRVAPIRGPESRIARDPGCRGATSSLAALLAGAAPVVALSLDDVRAGREKIAHVLEQHPGAVVAADAETDDDLASLAQAALSVPGTLAVGSAGLGRAVSTPRVPRAVVLPAGPARLVVVGSPPGQPCAARGAGRAGVAWTTVDAPATATRPQGSRSSAALRWWRAPPRRLAPMRRWPVTWPGRRILDRAPRIRGGHWRRHRYALIQALRPRHFELLGAPAAGLALGRLALEGGRVLPLLTKAGGFGGPDLFTTLLGGTP